jgi:hypothetical protein
MRLARMPCRPAAAVALTKVLRFMMPSSGLKSGVLFEF